MRSSGLRQPVAALVSLILVIGCSKPPPPQDDVRPVRVVKLTPVAGQAAAEFSGEIKPRVESRVGFQVAGRIASRRAELGQLVRAQDVLATLDSADYRLNAAAAAAALAAALVDRNQQRSDFARYTELQQRSFISAADLERRRATLDAAEARYLQAAAQADVSSNQASYATLRAPVDGVITAVEAETGQVVTAGQTVVRIAQRGGPADKEVVVALPESRLAQLQTLSNVEIRIWALGESKVLKGKVREIAPMAEAGSRTYSARITLLDAPPQVALGMTATVSFVAPVNAPVVSVPLQALYREGTETSVWTLDAQSMTVKRSAVQVVNVVGNDAVLGGGVMPGQSVVTAGVHLLKEGQKVKVLAATDAIDASAANQPMR